MRLGIGSLIAVDNLEVTLRILTVITQDKQLTPALVTSLVARILV